VSDPKARLAGLSEEKRALLALLHQGDTAPRTALERTLADLWRDVLDAPEVHRRSHYFELGGDSIQSIQVVARARRAGIDLSTAQIMAYPVLADLADAVAQGRRADAERDDRPLDDTSFEGWELTPAQTGMLYQCEAHPEACLYVSRLGWSWHGPLDFDVLCMAWNHVLLRHDACRLHIVRTRDGLPMQRVDPVVDCEVHFEQAQDVAAATERLYRAWDPSLRDVYHAPLIRVGVIEGPEGVSRIAIAHHHLILDGWSQTLLVDAWMRAYGSFLRGDEAMDGDTVSFADALSLNARVPSFDAGFWKGHFADFRPARRHESTRSPVGVGVVHPIGLPTNAAYALPGLARAAGTTFATVIQLAWGAALAALGETNDVVIGMVLSGRDASVDLTRVVGMLINTVPARLRFSAGQTIGEWLDAQRRTMAELFPHGGESLAAITRGTVLGDPGAIGSLLVIENMPVPTVVPEGVTFDQLEYEVMEGFPVVVVVHPGDALSIHVKSDSPASEGGETVVRLCRAFERTIASLCDATPDGRVDDLLRHARPAATGLANARREAVTGDGGGVA